MCKWLILFNLLGLPTAALAQPPSNLDFLTTLTDSLLEQVSNAVRRHWKAVAALDRMTAEHPDNWFFEDRLTHLLARQKNGSVRFVDYARDSSWVEQGALVFAFRPIALGIRYRPIEGANGRGTDAHLVSRIGSVRLYLRVVDLPEGAVVWSGEVVGERRDRINSESLAELETPGVPFTRGKLAFAQGDSKVAQAVVLTVVTGGLVYLLYTLRSR